MRDRVLAIDEPRPAVAAVTSVGTGSTRVTTRRAAVVARRDRARAPRERPDAGERQDRRRAPPGRRERQAEAEPPQPPRAGARRLAAGAPPAPAPSRVRQPADRRQARFVARSAGSSSSTVPSPTHERTEIRHGPSRSPSRSRRWHRRAPAARGLELGFFDPVFSSPAGDERGLWLDRARGAGDQVVRVNPAVDRRRAGAPGRSHEPGRSGLPLDGRPTPPCATPPHAACGSSSRSAALPGWAQQATPAPTSPTPAAGSPTRPPLARSRRRRRDPLLGRHPRSRPARRPSCPPSGRGRSGTSRTSPSTSLPQWRTAVRSQPRTTARCSNAAYARSRRSTPRTWSATAGTAPYGDPRRRRTADHAAALLARAAVPAREGAAARACPRRPARFDASAHHPYGVSGPTTHALNADDAAVPDIGRISALVRAAVSRRTVVPARAKQAWVTEVSWDSSPPDPDGVSGARQAAWLSQALSILWRQHVAVVTWFRMRDQPPVPSYAATNQSGVYLLSGEPKTVAAGLRLPASPANACGRGTTAVWGRAPGAGPGHRRAPRRGGAWRRVRHDQVGRARMLQARLTGRATFRAREAAAASLPLCEIGIACQIRLGSCVVRRDNPPPPARGRGTKEPR